MRDWLSHRAASTPDDLALIDTDSDTRWSYNGLDAAVDETAGRLAALGAESGDQVGMILSTQLLSVCLIHAAQRLGLRLVPLNDKLTIAELSAQIDQVDLTMLVCGSETEQVAIESAAGAVPVASVDDPQWEDVQSFRDVDPEPISPADWEMDDPQLIVFTSGSTGSPKAVILTMGNLLASAVASGFRLGIDPDDRWLLTLSLYHVGGIAPILRSTLYGTAIVLRPSFDPGTAADDIDRFDVTVVSLVPTMLQRMLERRGTLSDSLRVVLLGGAPAPDPLIQRCRNYSIPVFPTYGMTETASQIATARPMEAFDDAGTVGRPLLWTELTIVDSAGEPVDSGQQGEIVVSGPTVTAGYYDDVEANVEAFCEHGLRTGDIGYQTGNGSLFVLNRVDDRIISGGENIDPGEVVDVLHDHPEISSAAVVGIPDDEWGQQVAALVVPTTDELTTSAIETHCREYLAGFKIPRTIALTDDLPRTASGSIKRQAVKAQLESVDEENSQREAADDTAEPPVDANGGDAELPVDVGDDDDALPIDDAESSPAEERSPSVANPSPTATVVDADAVDQRDAGSTDPDIEDAEMGVSPPSNATESNSEPTQSTSTETEEPDSTTDESSPPDNTKPDESPSK